MAGLVHSRIEKIAREMAQIGYEQNASNNKFYKKWPSRKAFVEKTYPRYVQAARAALVGLLKGDNPNIDEKMKQEIYEALIDDRTLPKGDFITAV